ncbi:Na/Pi cotransporter family protein [Spirochaetota bacterium]
MNNIGIAVTIFGGLGLFLYGMKIMSESLQMATGDGLRNVLLKVTNNRVLGVITGFFITGVIQSSSATTVMLVSFVNAGLLNLQQSIGIILGANIGTTITGWIVAIFGFKVKIASFALPAIALGFFVRFIRYEKVQQWGNVLLGFGILFLGLSIMKNSVNVLKGSESVMNFMAAYKADSIPSTLAVVLIGGIVTMIIQSSSATMAMTMALAYNGLIDFPTSCALILGENIGTTITANIASIGTTTAAKRTARVHFLFNIIGVIWVLLIFKAFFIPLIDAIVPGDPYSTSASSSVIADHMAGFHTVFNITNTVLFLPFVNMLAKIATKLVTDKDKKTDEDEFHLKYISTALLHTPSINIDQAKLETRRMIEIVSEMFELVIEVFQNPTTKLGKIIKSIQEKENATDILEKEISEFLVRVSKHNISSDQSVEISTLLHSVNEIERIGDHCEILMKLIRRKYDNKLDFSEKADKEIMEIAIKVREFLQILLENISEYSNIIDDAKLVENRIDELRKEFRKKHISRLNEGRCDVPSGLLYIDMLTSFEKIGDHAFNIAESISGRRVY